MTLKLEGTKNLDLSAENETQFYRKVNFALADLNRLMKEKHEKQQQLKHDTFPIRQKQSDDMKQTEQEDNRNDDDENDVDSCTNVENHLNEGDFEDDVDEEDDNDDFSNEIIDDRRESDNHEEMSHHLLEEMENQVVQQIEEISKMGLKIQELERQLSLGQQQQQQDHHYEKDHKQEKEEKMTSTDNSSNTEEGELKKHEVEGVQKEEMEKSLFNRQHLVKEKELKSMATRSDDGDNLRHCSSIAPWKDIRKTENQHMQRLLEHREKIHLEIVSSNDEEDNVSDDDFDEKQSSHKIKLEEVTEKLDEMEQQLLEQIKLSKEQNKDQSNATIKNHSHNKSSQKLDLYEETKMDSKELREERHEYTSTINEDVLLLEPIPFSSSNDVEYLRKRIEQLETKVHHSDQLLSTKEKEVARVKDENELLQKTIQKLKEENKRERRNSQRKVEKLMKRHSQEIQKFKRQNMTTSQAIVDDEHLNNRIFNEFLMK